MNEAYDYIRAFLLISYKTNHVANPKKSPHKLGDTIPISGKFGVLVHHLAMARLARVVVRDAASCPPGWHEEEADVF